MAIDAQLPTPPYESEDEPTFSIHGSSSPRAECSRWFSSGVVSGGSVPTPPKEDDLLNFSPMNDMSPFGDTDGDDALQQSFQRFDFPEPSDRASTTSSNEAEPDLELDGADLDVDVDVADGDVRMSPTQWLNLLGVGTPPGSSAATSDAIVLSIHFDPLLLRIG
ncbi:hypothetical protein PC9H_009135 [Pleurotus ostreatus]|uniref:Uncharacterized protein n=2 Tax=Pleurotus ostreatus TaxID=5322 RepID=A0A067N1V6_PLEO1|nr:uncharacterized protein PC9H_009135 [Pleurotus ostreatus]KAF7426766.1 hypothetical protein PC9H_009135 [Pleurotus ostreatus]KAJ8694373.1 hypothetical protein PTI98_009297 [Pleurotus ostreatus]KDQ21998.1 hypothetical protein PLEOSDRAFT_1087459 [Pleurotus ostreatus PC15]